MMYRAVPDDISDGASEFILDFGCWILDSRTHCGSPFFWIQNRKSRTQSRRLTRRLCKCLRGDILGL